MFLYLYLNDVACDIQMVLDNCREIIICRDYKSNRGGLPVEDSKCDSWHWVYDIQMVLHDLDGGSRGLSRSI